MPTEIIRPDSTTSETGWDTPNIHTVIGDGDAATEAEQTSTTCNATVTLGNPSFADSSTINSITSTFRGVAGRTGNNTVQITYSHSTDGAFGGETKTVTTDANYNYSAVTTQQDGSSALTFEYVKNLSLIIVPGTSGVTAKDVFVTVDYTLATLASADPYDNTVNNLHITSGNVSVQSDNIFI